MRSWTLLVLAMATAFPPPARAAQKPAPDAQETAQPHTPPAAPKSVEIGHFYFKKKNYRAALSRYQEAAHTDPNYAPAFLGLGRTYEKMGFDPKALEAYRRYLDALPSTKQAEQAKEVHRAIARLDKKLKHR